MTDFHSWHHYPSIFAMGHRAIASLLTVPVNVEEKVDGSQFSFGLHPENGELMIRSKGCQMMIDCPEKMFSAAAQTVKDVGHLLVPGWTYRAEYLAKPKHNALCYNRNPEKHLIVFDVNTDHESYLPYEEKAREAARIGLECVPLIYSGMVNTLLEFRSFIDRESVLGGQKVEGVVVKPRDYSLFGPDKKCLMGKFVSEAFKEIHAHEWKEANPKQGDIIERLEAMLRTPARWHKAVQHLREAGALEGSPRDIPALLKEVSSDTHKECATEIAEFLFKWAWPQVQRRIIRGLPEWYKDELLKAQFEVTTEEIK